MPRQNMNMDGKIGGRKEKVRKRGCSSSSSSSLAKNYRLKRTFFVGKRTGSTTPVPMWKMMSSEPPLLENDKAFKNLAGKNGEKVKDQFSVSARKLAAILWEINGLPSPRVKRDMLEDKISEVGTVRKERVLESSKLSSMELGLSEPFHSPVSERMDPQRLGSHKRKNSAGSRKLLLADCNLGGATSIQNSLVQVDEAQTQARNIHGLKNHLKDVYNNLTTAKELLKLLIRIGHLQESSTSLSLISALKIELQQASTYVNKLIQGQKTKNEIDVIKEKSIAKELEMEKKLRRQTEKLNAKLGRELAETKASLSRANKEIEDEKRAREIVEQVCDELARGIGEDRAEVDEIKKESEKVREEVEKEREMFHLADLIREERVQMKLSEAKYLFEEKNALIENMRCELEAYLESKKGEEEKQGDGFTSYEKIKELEKYLRETFMGPYQNQGKEKEDTKNVNKGDKDEDDDDSDLCSIELNMDDITKSFQWGEATKKGSNRNSCDKNEKPIFFPKPEFGDGIDVYDKRGLFELVSHSSKKDVEEEMERYNMIKDLRDHIVSGSRMASSQNLASPGKENLGHSSFSSNGHDGVVYHFMPGNLCGGC